jgi:amidase
MKGSQKKNPGWLELCNIKQAERERAIPADWRIPASCLTTEKKNLIDVPATCGILTEEEIKITAEFNAIDLLEQIKSGKLSSEAVTIAFCKRAAIAQQLVRIFRTSFILNFILSSENFYSRLTV